MSSLGQLRETLMALDLKAVPCDYCDVRIESVRKTAISYRNGELLSCDLKPSLGAFLRVYARGKWFYASITELDQIQARLAALAAQAPSFSPNGVSVDLFSGIQPYNRELIRYGERSVADIGVQAKRQLCESYLPLLKAEPLAIDSRVGYGDVSKLKLFRSSKGVFYAFDYEQAGITFQYTLKEGEDLFEDMFRQSYDVFQGLDQLQDGLRAAMTESKRFLKAKPIVPAQYRVVLDSAVVGVFAHESFGHNSEADAHLGDDSAGEKWAIGSRVGSDAVSIYDDGTRAGSSGYCPFDDEGTPAQRTALIEKGILKGRLHSLTTAQHFGEAPTGNARSIDFEFEPIVRMTSTYVEPGTLSLDEILAKAGEGVFIQDWKHGSGLSTFTIAPRKCYRIQQGKLAEPLRASVITGTVFETLANIEACSKDFELHSSVFGGCGKNDQAPLPVSDGGPVILVSAMQVS
jgi:TldD protein